MRGVTQAFVCISYRQLSMQYAPAGEAGAIQSSREDRVAPVTLASIIAFGDTLYADKTVESNRPAAMLPQ